ncbi:MULTISPECIES: hypothetical protein [Fictibacillus]|uniref:Uncharacterized protein n=1 Tax=Fictibacillus terranigra TaxID=3058424 RepID=A0ABT8E1I8_9BACL|nr:hypothetical protein [Fictibacillus sp. CENA-BCM004]MDN4071755.1 hypothetical protein [Fictibacillus sp. CENA-BCM004]
MADEIGFFKGCMWGLGLSLPLWALIIMVAIFINHAVNTHH